MSFTVHLADFFYMTFLNHGKFRTNGFFAMEFPLKSLRFGTGALKITPAHDFNDFEIGQRHGLDNHTVTLGGRVMEKRWCFQESGPNKV